MRRVAVVLPSAAGKSGYAFLAKSPIQVEVYSEADLEDYNGIFPYCFQPIGTADQSK
mgnify:CR=1 FL=1